MNIIETLGLTCRFRRLEAVCGLDLAVPAGSVFALLGPNGAGKTTTIKLLLNLLTPNSGTARVLGADSRRLSPREFAQIGYVSENLALPEWMTVAAFNDYCRPFHPGWDRELENTLMAKFELPADRKLKHLSRGMKMKALLLSVLAHRPTLLVLDEPFSGLDPVVRDDFIRGVLEVSSLGDWTVFLSSHDIEEVERLADHIAFIDHGRLQLSEPLDSLQNRFRRLEITRPITSEPQTVNRKQETFPTSWHDYAEAGSLVRFVESRYVPDESERRCLELFPGAAVAVQPLPLREIYLTLARQVRTSNSIRS
ncbi:MAG: ABC transporter ATP-binding protein [Opitutales bacterium]|jgi:ABC-2 type transport system ATP-binding protein